jgi:hypothetical protein
MVGILLSPCRVSGTSASNGASRVRTADRYTFHKEAP